MKILGKDHKPVRQRRKLTAEEKLKEFTFQALIEMARKDRRILAQLIKKYTGIEVPTSDDTEASIREMENQLHKKALQRMLDRPDIIDAVAEAELEREFPGLGLSLKGNAGGTKKGTSDEGTAKKEQADPIKRATDLLDEADKLKQKLGISGLSIFLNRLLDPAVVGPALAILAKLLGVDQPAPYEGSTSPERECLFMHNGHLTRAPESRYRELAAAGQAQPVAEVRTGGAPLPPSGTMAPQSEPPKSPPPQSAKASQSQPIDLEKLFAILDSSPANAVDQIEQYLPTNMVALGLWLYVTRPAITLETITEQLRQYVSHPVYGPYATRLLSNSGRIWLAEVVRLTKECSTAYDKS